MKQIILGLLFVIGMMGEGQAQERAVATNKVYDLLGLINKDTETPILNNLIQQVNQDKGWEIIITTFTQSSIFVSRNSENFIKTGKRIVISMPKDVKDKPRILVSQQVEDEITAAEIRRIEELVLKPIFNTQGFFPAAKATLDALLGMDSDIKILENPNQVFGFDANDVIGYSSSDGGFDVTTSSSIIINPKPWKSLVENLSDVLNINVKSIPNLTEIKIKSANTNLLSQSITAITKKDDTYTIAATGPTGNVYPSITFEYGNISQKYVKSKLNIVSYKKKDSKKIGYICVSSKKKNKQIVTNILDKVKDANGNDVENPIFTRIETEIDNQYSDAGVYFPVQDNLGNIEIDFDTNDNGIMDGKSAITGFTFGEELSVIKNYIMALPVINNYNFIVVFVNNPGNKAVGATNVTINKEIWGIAEDVKDKICFVFPSNHSDLDRKALYAIESTTAHELGHLHGISKHAHDECDGGKADNTNIMYSEEGGTVPSVDFKDGKRIKKQFRKYSWDTRLNASNQTKR